MPQTDPVFRAIAALAERRDLPATLAAQAFGQVMAGEATPALMAALLMGLRVKGETAEELQGATLALREAMVRVSPRTLDHLVDTCGTGGGAVGTFNISTVAAFVAAGAGARVAKHGNRSFTSRSGSADVLEALGIPFSIRRENVLGLKHLRTFDTAPSMRNNGLPSFFIYSIVAPPVIPSVIPCCFACPLTWRSAVYVFALPTKSMILASISSTLSPRPGNHPFLYPT